MKGIIIFVRNPELGKVKTRLASTLGDEKALEVYQKLLRYSRSVLMDADADIKYVFYAGDGDIQSFWPSEEFVCKSQIEGDLGEKMMAAFDSAFQECSECLIIGSDCAELETKHISQAFKLLETNDIVLGPSTDGGYYLCGMKKPSPELFRDMEWSTSTVLRETIGRCVENRWAYGLLQPLTDIDEEADYRKFESRLSSFIA